jgi:hypothetical protein
LRLQLTMTTPRPPATPDPTVPQRGAVLAAALALPGVVAAEEPPTERVVAFKYLWYHDQQPGLSRITVNSPSVYTLFPVGSSWSLEGALVVDAVSGATPRYHTAISSASVMSDTRVAPELKLTRYFRRAALGFGLAYSTEDDYKSTAASVDLRMSSEDNNTTVALGTGFASDRINSNGGATTGDTKQTNDFLVGLTQVLTPNDIARINVTHARGRGYFSDPYKELDNRPRHRNQTAVLTQWNHSFASESILRSSYRYYWDSFGVKANAVDFAFAQGIGAEWTLTPAFRYYTQSAADFYFDPIYDPVLGPPFPPNYLTNPPVYSSADQRLSAFGAITIGMRVDKRFGPWNVDFRYDYYQQRGDWRLGGEGSPGLAPFTAHFVQVGLTKRF